MQLIHHALHGLSLAGAGQAMSAVMHCLAKGQVTALQVIVCLMHHNQCRTAAEPQTQ